MRLFTTLLLLISCPAIAQEKLGTPKYSPDYCQFTVTFPDDAYETHKCENPEDPTTCYDLITYTKVFDLSTTVRFEIICNPGSPELYENFTEKVMEDTVKAMTKDTVVETYEVRTNQREEYRHTGLVGKGKKGLYDTLLITQLWIADQSIMSVEAEVIGETREDADRLFAEILQTIGYAEEINKQAPPSPESAPPSP